jgi:hypothetical protein
MGAAGSPGTPALPPSIAIANIVLTQGRLTYRDGATGAVTPVAIERLALRARDFSAPIAAEFRGAVAQVPVALEGTFGSVDALLAKRSPYPVNVQGEVAGQKTVVVTNVGVEGARYRLGDLRIQLGGNALTGTFTVETGGPRPRVAFDLKGPALAFNALPVAVTLPAAGGAGQGTAPVPAKQGRKYLFSDAPMNFAALRLADATGALAVGRLTLPDGHAFDNLRIAFTLDDGRLALSSFAVALFGGTLSGSATIDAAPGAVAVSTQLTGKGLALADLLALAGQKRAVRGGKTDVTAQLAMRGDSLHAWASTATGHVTAVVGPASLGNTQLDLAEPVDQLTRAVNPFRDVQPTTELECAVVRLPLANGISHVDRSIGVETKELGLTASGTLDFRSETLDFSFRPQVRKGLTIPIPNLAELVRLSGPFAAPQVKVDAAGSAKAIASIGVAVGTAGLSALGQMLYSWSEGAGPGPCKVALGAPVGKGEPAPARRPEPGAADPVTEGIGKAFGKLFGK